MADARALLRAHRAENRIKHPHAAYSDAGKLLCKLCHEPVKTEALWDNHVRSPNHKKRLQALQSSQQPPPSATDRSNGGGTKRKHDDVDESTSDADEDAEEAIRKKRSRPDLAVSTSSSGGEKRQSPPTLGTRTSNTPVHGVEIAIPSRPATPAAGSNSATSTPKAAPVGRSPLIGPEATSATSTSTSSSTPSTQPALPISTQSLAVPSTTTNTTTTSQPAAGPIDEAEWAAFEAELAAEASAGQALASYSAEATISAPALTAAQVAARSQEEENERRRHLEADAELADEREDATRALEAEFEEMEELEGRVRRLKERREELRKGSAANLRPTAAAIAAEEDVVMAKSPADGVEANSAGMEVIGEEEDEDDYDDDDDDDDDWAAFRLR